MTNWKGEVVCVYVAEVPSGRQDPIFLPPTLRKSVVFIQWESFDCQTSPIVANPVHVRIASYLGGVRDEQRVVIRPSWPIQCTFA